MINKTTGILNLSELSEGGVLMINKPAGKTSFDIIRELRRTLKIKKIGHAGTLDPAAQGLLIVCTGKKTKEISKFQDLHKTYTGIITLGITTPSLDRETEPVSFKSVDDINEEQVLKIKEDFTGEIEQIPPMYSALKHKGKALYKYARKGLVIERQPRRVSVYRFDILKIDLPDIHFEIECSKGTYIRSIANDLGEKLGCGGYLKELKRTAIGDFNLEDAFLLDEINQFSLRDL